MGAVAGAAVGGAVVGAVVMGNHGAIGGALGDGANAVGGFASVRLYKLNPVY